MALFVCGTQSFCCSLLVNPLSHSLIRRHSPTAFIVFVILLKNSKKKKERKENSKEEKEEAGKSTVNTAKSPCGKFLTVLERYNFLKITEKFQNADHHFEKSSVVDNVEKSTSLSGV